MELTEHHIETLRTYIGDDLIFGKATDRTLLWYCPSCGNVISVDEEAKPIHRCNKAKTFTTPADLWAVYSKMVEKGEWDAFMSSQYTIFVISARPRIIHIDEFTAWLSCYGIPDQIPARMEMAANFVEEGKNESNRIV